MNRIKKLLSGFVNNGTERSVIAKKNIILSILIKGLSVLLNLAIVPLTIDYVNPTQYGIWLTLSSIVHWFSFLDVGIGNGLRNRFAEAKALGNTEMAKSLISTTYFILFVVFLSFWVVFVIFNQFIPWSTVLNVPMEMNDELSKLIFIVVSLFCIEMIGKIITTIVSADQKTALASFVILLSQLLVLLFILFFKKFTSGSLINLGISIGVSPIIVLLLFSIYLFSGAYKEYRPSVKTIDLKLTKSILKIGIKFFIIQISVIVVLQTTNLIISHTLGAEYVTVYNIAYKYFFIISMLFTIIMVPFWPAFTEAFVKKDYIWMQNVTKKLENIWYYVIPILIVMIVFSAMFYKVWIGNRVSIPLTISILMAIYTLVYIRANLYMYLINGIGKVHLQLVLYLVNSLVFIPLAYYLSNMFGLEGIIIANILVFVNIAILCQVQIKKLIFRQNAKGIWIK